MSDQSETTNTTDEANEQTAPVTEPRDSQTQEAFDKASAREVPARDVNAATGEPATYAGEPQTAPRDRDDPRNYEQNREAAPGSLPEGVEVDTVEKPTAFTESAENEGLIGEDLEPEDTSGSVANNNAGSAGNEGGGTFEAASEGEQARYDELVAADVSAEDAQRSVEAERQ